MTVKELIAKLKDMPQDLVVYDHSFLEVDDAVIRQQYLYDDDQKERTFVKLE